ncbi:M15 family metallopeptidase [Hoyosella rhizosphaerae]|uniref:D-alanyl-D-alanine carboxypeptidase-like core domain-containing protein n=1 Tax=Hoyosella rhizosphaerae TaxID=1755582 RepID=A0A916X9W4_9ACTN|nr:M15 family metallopeptidase [Hoyosella rhizosphaerae]MBN4926575.1 M15 family metallopeptidase [Hoyosella rhizosphaerae]GGC58184.1 hypothetical protein GCM10011410_08330 [Hoyosella rhizosphaerae]
MRRVAVGLAVTTSLFAVGMSSVAAQPLTGSADGTDGLNPLLAVAYTLAEAEARAQGVPMWVTSGFRTRAEQQRLWEQGVATYGSPEASRPWVLPPDESTHVTGDALDIGPAEGAAWMKANGHRYGVCQTYANEWWHFEFATLPGTPCPAPLPDASWR